MFNLVEDRKASAGIGFETFSDETHLLLDIVSVIVFAPASTAYILSSPLPSLVLASLQFFVDNTMAPQVNSPQSGLAPYSSSE
jgi:hypothetical protein